MSLHVHLGRAVRDTSGPEMLNLQFDGGESRIDGTADIVIQQRAGDPAVIPSKFQVLQLLDMVETSSSARRTRKKALSAAQAKLKCRCFGVGREARKYRARVRLRLDTLRLLQVLTSL